MNNRIISDITDYIFITDKPKKVDVIFLPGGSEPALHENGIDRVMGELSRCGNQFVDEVKGCLK